MQIDVKDKNDSSRIGILELNDGAPTLKPGDQLRIYSEDNRCSRLFFVVKPKDTTGIATLVNGNMRTGDNLLVEDVRP